MGPAVGFAVGCAQVAEPVSRESMPTPAEEKPVAKTEAHIAKSVPEEKEETAMEVTKLLVPEITESQSIPGVHLDVVGSDVVVTVDTALLASPERDRESRTQKLSTYLSTRFHRTPVPRVAYM